VVSSDCTLASPGPTTRFPNYGSVPTSRRLDEREEDEDEGAERGPDCDAYCGPHCRSSKDEFRPECHQCVQCNNGGLGPGAMPDLPVPPHMSVKHEGHDDDESEFRYNTNTVTPADIRKQYGVGSYESPSMNSNPFRQCDGPRPPAGQAVVSFLSEFINKADLAKFLKKYACTPCSAIPSAHRCSRLLGTTRRALEDKCMCEIRQTRSEPTPAVAGLLRLRWISSNAHKICLNSPVVIPRVICVGTLCQWELTCQPWFGGLRAFLPIQ
jgi:hypothetical protein